MLNYKYLVIPCLIILIIYLIVSVYLEKDKNYANQYDKCIATIINKNIESEDYIEKSGLNNFSHKKKFRIKLFYEYTIKNIKYYGSYYNDGNNEKYLFESEYIPIGNTYNYVKKINIYYNKKNNQKSYKNLNIINNNKKKVYYILTIFCIVLLFLISLI